MVATGEVMGLYRAMTKNETLKARLAISSEMIDCNQLINSFSLSEDSVSVAVTDTVSPTEMKLFVLPDNLDFELQTDLKKVVFGKVEFEDVCGKVDLKNRTLYLRNLEMRALDADMKAVMVYRADSVRGGYTGFDFKIRDINIAKLVDFIPSMDTIVPMLRSFEGRVQFDVAAEARLDSNMNIRIPTLRSAMYIKGDSLVLMDGETFAEISKMLMFKNKKKNVFDSISVNVVVNDGSVLVYPFQVSIDRYKAAIGGEQGLDMNFKYHISILKSPLPFKAGVNISGNLDKMKIRVGFGFDVHQLVAGRELWLGGIRLEHEKGLLGHSDADVLIHTICDALLGAANMRDIGYHFPDTAGEFKNIDSKILLKKTIELIATKGYSVGNIDATICAERPKLKAYIPEMQRTLAAVMGIDEDAISIKATTTEKLGFTGREEGISAYATVLIVKE